MTRMTLSAQTLLLPVCCVCKLIRDKMETSLDERWVTKRMYHKTHGVNPAECLVTHTYCPGCYTQVLDRMKAA